MKFSTFTVLLLGLIIGCSKAAEMNTVSGDADTHSSDKTTTSKRVHTVLAKDTLKIVDSAFTVDPFDLGENPLRRLTSIERSLTSYQICKNRHVVNRIDTSFQVRISVDTFEVYQTVSKNWVTAADINSDRFSIKQVIRIGMTKSEVKEKLKTAENLPNSVRIQNLEVLEWIDLIFKKDRLEKIEFKMCLDKKNVLWHRFEQMRTKSMSSVLRTIVDCFIP